MAFTRQEMILLFSFGFAQFCSGLCISLQAPFYPKEAEDKGATATQYGLVFGMYQLVVFIISPYCGKFLPHLGANFMLKSGLFMVGVSCIIFGFLDKINDLTIFLIYSYICRITEAIGCSLFSTAAYAIVAEKFTDNVATIFASLETFFGIGLIFGPTVGGALYELGGYVFPFLVDGIVVLISMIVVFFILPKEDYSNHKPSTGKLRLVLSHPSILILIYAIIAPSFGIGYNQVTLERHLRDNWKLTPFQTGSFFVLSGSMYALTSSIWGRIVDKCLSADAVICIGVILTMTSFTFIGPLPFLPLKPQIWMVIVCLLIHGIGIGSLMIASFAGLLRESVSLGFPKDKSTYGIISGIIVSSFGFGAFAGPIIGGFLLDKIGYRWGTVFVLVMYAFVLILVLCKTVYLRLSSASERTNLLSENDSKYGSINDISGISSERTNIIIENEHSTMSNGNQTQTI